MQNSREAVSIFTRITVLFAVYLSTLLILVTPVHATNWLPVEDATFLNSSNEYWIHVSNQIFSKYKLREVQKCSDLIKENMSEHSDRPVVLKQYHNKSVQYIGQNFFGSDAQWSTLNTTKRELESSRVLAQIDIDLPLSRFRIDKDTVETFEKISKNISYEKFDQNFTYSILIAKEHKSEGSVTLKPSKWEIGLARELNSVSLKCTDSRIK